MAVVSVPAAGAGAELPLSAEELLARFSTSDPRHEILAASIARARAEVRSAEILGNPSIAYDREEIFAEGTSASENYLRASVSLELAGRRGALIRAAEAAAESAEASAEHRRRQLSFDALELYLHAAEARLKAEVIERERAALEEVLATVRARTTAGEASGYDADRLELELAGQDDLAAEARARSARLSRTLASWIGLEGGRVIATDALALPEPPTQSEPGLEAREDHRALQRQVEEAEHLISAARRRWLPELILTGGLKTADGDLGYVAGIALDLPLFDRGQAEQERAAAERQLAAARARVLSREARLAAQNAAAELTLALERARKYRQSHLPKLEALLRRATLSHREGERPISELLDAHRLAREVRLKELELRGAARRSEVELWRAIGRRPGGDEP